MAPAHVSDGRAGAMGARVAATARRLGVDPDGRELLATAFDVAMAPRTAAGLDDHHPDYLHPARTALILMDDAHLADPAALAAAILTESRDPGLRAEPTAIARLGPDVMALAAEVAALGDASERAAGTDGAGLLERLVLATAPARLIALAERLDHARHLHLRDPTEWAPYHATTCEGFGPAASRSHPTLERRFRWWCRTFSERYLDRR